VQAGVTTIFNPAAGGLPIPVSGYRHPRSSIRPRPLPSRRPMARPIGWAELAGPLSRINVRTTRRKIETDSGLQRIGALAHAPLFRHRLFSKAVSKRRVDRRFPKASTTAVGKWVAGVEADIPASLGRRTQHRPFFFRPCPGAPLMQSGRSGRRRRPAEGRLNRAANTWIVRHGGAGASGASVTPDTLNYIPTWLPSPLLRSRPAGHHLPGSARGVERMANVAATASWSASTTPRNQGGLDGRRRPRGATSAQT